MGSGGRRKRQRAMSAASDDADPRQRLEAFRARMFDLQPEIPSAAAASGDAMPAVQWKTSGRKGQRRRQALQGPEDGGEDAVPSVKFVKRKREAQPAQSSGMPSVGIGRAGAVLAAKPAVATHAPLKKKKKVAADATARLFVEDENPLADLTKSLREKMAAEEERNAKKVQKAARAKAAVQPGAAEAKAGKVKTKVKAKVKAEADAEVSATVNEKRNEAEEDRAGHANRDETISTGLHLSPVVQEEKNGLTMSDALVSNAPKLSKAQKKRMRKRARKLSNAEDQHRVTANTEAPNACDDVLQPEKPSEKIQHEQKLSCNVAIAILDSNAPKKPDKQHSTSSDTNKTDAKKKIASTKKTASIEVVPANKIASTKRFGATENASTKMIVKDTLTKADSSKPSGTASLLPKGMLPKRLPHGGITSKASETSRAKSGPSDASEDDSDDDVPTSRVNSKNHFDFDTPLVVSDISDTEVSGSDVSSSSDDEDDSSISSQHQRLLFSGLIDEAARNQWELQEVGRLVRLFSGLGWGQDTQDTAKFLRHYCPELVSAEFLDGLEVKLSSKQLLGIFDRGSGTPDVFVTKVASAVENGYLNAKDSVVAKALTAKIAKLADPSTRGMLVFLMPLLESLSNVRQFGGLMRRICHHWQPERIASLVQQILLTSVFDDLEGDQDDILAYLPQLKGLIDFPSRMANEDADENGNLIGLIASDDEDGKRSDEEDEEDDPEAALGEILSEDEDDDSEHDDIEYEGETDSEEEREIARRYSSKHRKRSRFILDEASEDDEEEEEDDTLGWEELVGSDEDDLE